MRYTIGCNLDCWYLSMVGITSTALDIDRYQTT